MALHVTPFPGMLKRSPQAEEKDHKALGLKQKICGAASANKVCWAAPTNKVSNSPHIHLFRGCAYEYKVSNSPKEGMSPEKKQYVEATKAKSS